MFQLDKKHQKYPKYNPTNIDWIGDIPDGWEVWKLKRLGNIETWNTPPKAEEGNYMEDGIPWIKPDNLDGFVPLNDSKEKLSQVWASQARIIKKGSVLVCGIGTIGKIGIAWCDLTTNQQINSITFNQKIDELFGQYLVFASRKEMEKQSNKVVVSILNKSQQSNIFYPVCSLQEQQKIADYLDEKTRILDEAIEKKKKQIELLAEHRTALINNAITKWLDPNVEMIDSGIEWIGKIPKGWEVKKIKYWASHKANKTEFNSESLIVALENIESWTGRYITLEENKIFDGDMNTFSSGDILFGKLRPYLAKVYKTNCEWLCVWEFLVLRPTTNILQNFLYYRLISSDFIDQVNNSTFWAKMPRADWDFIWNSKIPVPALEEQKLIVDYLDKETRYIDDMIAKIEKSIELLEEYKTSLISHVVSGKIRVS